MTAETLETFASISDNLVWSGTVVLALAFLCHVAEWAFARQVDVDEREPVRELVGAGAGTPGPADGSDELGGVEREALAGRIGVALTVVAAALVTGGAVFRGLAAENVPWTNMWGFSISVSAVALVSYLVAVRLTGVQWLGGLVTGFIVVVLGFSNLVYVPPGPTVPALDSYWLVLHVATAMISGGCFLVGAALSVLYLVRERAEQRAAADPDARRGYVWRLPASGAIDRLSYRVHALAFPIWTFAALISGPIWAQHAWGRYWGWDPKEVWAFITWVAYAGYLHARATAGWRGKGAAVLALVAFATFVFNYVGVNLFVGGLHSYAK